MQYRIVLRTMRSGYFRYFVQYRWMLLFWRYTKSKYPFDVFEDAEKSVKARIKADRDIKQSKFIKTTVIKKYYYDDSRILFWIWFILLFMLIGVAIGHFIVELIK